MGDNQETNETVVSPTVELDLSPLIDKLNDLNVQQGEIIKNQKVLIEHFVPTDEEVKAEENKAKQLEKIQIEEEKKIKKEQEENYKTFFEDLNCVYSQDFEDLKMELGKLNESNIISNDFNSTSTGLSYILVFGLLFTFVIYFLYKLIRRFY